MATIEKRGKSYRITSSCGYTVRGNQERQRMTWTPDSGMTERQIEKELNRQAVLFDEECKQGTIQQRSVKFEEFVEQYLEDYAAQNLRIRTVVEYRRMGKRVCKTIGSFKMDRISPTQIQRLVRLLLDGNKEYKPMMPKTAKDYLSFVSSVFNYAIQMRVAKTNPCNAIHIKPGEKEEIDCYTPEEAQLFLDILAKEPLHYQAFFVLAIYGGFRRGELCGLEWKDIEFETGVISIRRTSEYTKSKGTFTDTTKTKKSQRSLKMPDEVIEVLRKHRLEQSAERLKVGDQWENSDRLFVAWNGRPINPNSSYNWMRKICERAGLRCTKSALHGLRHLNASLLITSGIDVKTVSVSLGHSQVSTTMNIYAHTFEKSQAAASEAIASALPLKSRA